VLAATALSLTACGSDKHGGNASQPTVPSSSASSSTAGSTNPASDQYNQLALQILDAVVRGDNAGATAHFDADLKENCRLTNLPRAGPIINKLSAITNRTEVRRRFR
jgi:hypothetical protein